MTTEGATPHRTDPEPRRGWGRRLRSPLGLGLSAAVAWLLGVGLWRVSPGPGATEIFYAGFDPARLGVFAGVAAVLLTAAFLVGLLARLLRAAGRPWQTALGVVAVIAVAAAGLVGAWIALTFVLLGSYYQPDYERFAAPDGTQYLLTTFSAESGKIAVYEKNGTATWRLVPQFGERYGIPGSPPCHGKATDTEIIVSCAYGEKPSTSRR